MNSKAEDFQLFIKYAIEAVNIAVRLHYQMAMEIKAYKLPEPEHGTEPSMAALMAKEDVGGARKRYRVSENINFRSGVTNNLGKIVDKFRAELTRNPGLGRHLPAVFTPPTEEYHDLTEGDFARYKPYIPKIGMALSHHFGDLIGFVTSTHIKDINESKRGIFSERARLLKCKLEDKLGKAQAHLLDARGPSSKTRWDHRRRMADKSNHGRG